MPPTRRCTTLWADSLASLDGHGTAAVASLWAKQPLLRRVDVDLYAQLQFDHKGLRDDIEVSGIHTYRHLNNWTASLMGDGRDALLAGGVTTLGRWEAPGFQLD